MKLQPCLDKLLEKYDVNCEAVIQDKNQAVIGGQETPLLSWRHERRFIELRNLIEEGAVREISVMRSLCIAPKGTPIDGLFLRELDLCEWILNERIYEIFAVENAGMARNAILKTESGIICSLELAATLAEGTQIHDKHEIISRGGVATDRVVDTQIPQSSIYVMKENAETEEYLDVDAELFGLSPEECAAVRQCFDMAKNGYVLTEEVKRLKRLTELSSESVQSGKNIRVEGEF